MKTYPELKSIMDEEPDLFKGLTPAREVKFKNWLLYNMRIYREFVKYAMILRSSRARKYYSARAIWERIRWETIIGDKPYGHYKLADRNMPFVSWLVMKAEPELAGMFQKKGRVDGDRV